MVKSNIISAVAEQAGLSKKSAAAAVDVVFAEMKSAFERDEKVAIDKFGVFEVKTRAARTCRNPKTNEKVDVPAKKTVGFKPSTGIKSALNG